MIYKTSLVYLALVSLVSVVVTCHDKLQAKRGGRRVPEMTLLNLSVFGGSVAMYLTMKLIRHKTRHPRFMVGIPVIILMQVLVIGSIIYLCR